MAYIVFIDGIAINPNDERIYVREAWIFMVIYKQKKEPCVSEKLSG